MSQLKIVYYHLPNQPLNFILTESAQHFPNETGGMLVGRVEGDSVLITHATGPGPLALHSGHEFKRDGEYSQKILDQIVTEVGGMYDYIGEWHSHPLKSGPSSKDIKTMNWISQNAKYKVAQPILGLCVLETKNIWRIEFYLCKEQSVIRLKPHMC